MNIKSTMAALARLATTGDLTGKKRNSADDGQKKHGILQGLKGIKKAIMPNSKSKGHQEPTETKEPTVEDIEEQIEKNQLLDASKNVIDLEHKILKDPLLQDKTEELESLYKKLESAVFQVIKDSITKTNGDLLSQAVNSIVDQEKEDSRRVLDNDSPKSTRPKQWKQKWEDYVRLSVSERIGNLSQVSNNDCSSSLCQSFLTVGKTLKQDLVHVVTHLKDHYPKDFDVCNTYAQHYHRFLVSQMDLVTEYVLTGQDTHYLLCWVHNYYPNMILKDPTLTGHIHESNLNNLLSPHMNSQLEKTYVDYEITSVKSYMNKSLDMEVDRWKNGREPEILGNCHHSELHIDIIQIYDGAIKRAGEIKKEMADKVSGLLPQEMKEFFSRYNTSLREFLDKNKTHSFYREIGIANLNCCVHFREFIERKGTKFDAGVQGPMLSSILQCEDLTYRELLAELFMALKLQFRKDSQSGSVCRYQNMQGMLKTAETTMSGFKTLRPPCYTEMIARIQKFLVKEYLRNLLKGKVRHKNALQLQTMAAQISEIGKLINEFCDAHNSQEEWIKPLIPKVAEIIRLQDPSAIQLEVATLVEQYPDIRNKQIAAILYIKKNLSSQDVKSILKVADAIERRPSSKPELFESF